MKKLYPALSVSVLAMLLLACTCYGMNSSETFMALTYLLWRVPEPGVDGLDCSRFYFTETSQDANGRIRVAWSAETEMIGVIYYHGDRELRQVSVENGIYSDSYTINWANLGSPDTVEVEVREFNVLGDLCIIRTSFNRPQSAAPVTMICENLVLTSPLGGMANGFQSFFWNSLQGATSYQLNLSYQGALLRSVDVAGDLTTVGLDVSTGAIGGETPLEVELVAFDAAGNSCRQTYSIAREAAPPQNPEPTAPATPTCQQQPSRPDC